MAAILRSYPKGTIIKFMAGEYAELGFVEWVAIQPEKEPEFCKFDFIHNVLFVDSISPDCEITMSIGA
jgi:hypothetical protein